MLDATDKKILGELAVNARIANAELAKRVGMVPSGVLERVRKLESKGIIQNYETRLDHKQIGFDLTTFVLVKTCEAVGATKLGEKLAELPCVQEVHFLAGEYCYLLKLRVRNVDAHARFLQQIGNLKGISGTQTTMVLKTLKETLALSLEEIS
ncbi:MAG: AsnC family transcriptional regulator [Lentisphaerae bacterium GWF2_52_8]|nr:MAG: AsnC family transcriptional regulator [Lentisphaerae bacterium GWF2_52_8]